jgi:hypothetical protein
MERVLAAAFASLVAAGLVFACSSSDDSTFTNKNPEPDADTTETGTFVNDGGNEGSPAKNCTATLPAAFTPTWVAPAKTPGACAPADIDGYYANCLTDPKDPGKCDTWVAANTTCANCIEPKNGAGPVQWHEYMGRKRTYVTFNIGGCVALEQGATTADSCGAALNGETDCEHAACDACYPTGGTDSEFLKCECDALGGAFDPSSGACKIQAGVQAQCTTYHNTRAQKCPSLTDGGTAQCLPSNPADAYLKSLIKIFCGT